MRRLILLTLTVAGALAPATATHALLAGGLSISAPSSVSLGAAPTGAATLSASLGPVKVTDSRTIAQSWLATVTSTSFTGAGLTVIPNSSVTYISGQATASTGLVTPVPGAPLGVTLEAQRRAFEGTVLALGGNTVTWTPTIRISLPANVLAGSYSGTITHSVS